MTAVQTLPATILTLGDVHELLGLRRGASLEFEDKLDLQALGEYEMREVGELQDLYFSYLADKGLNEGQVKFLLISPLLNLAGFLSGDIKITLEENIAEINIEGEDEEIAIKGRMDLLAVKRGTKTPFWILVIETKSGTGATGLGTAQLLTYAYKGLDGQEFVWGLTTNGDDYQFFLVTQGDPPLYQQLPPLKLSYPKSSHTLLQVLKAIRVSI